MRRGAAPPWRGRGLTLRLLRRETRNCELKIAHYKALMDTKEDILAAITIYEKVAAVSLESNLLKWSVKQYYMKALLAYLVLASNELGVSTDDVREKRAEYCSLDPTFEETREDNLITGALNAVEEGDPEAFATACSEFDEITKLDQWQTTLLLKAKNVRPGVLVALLPSTCVCAGSVSLYDHLRLCTLQGIDNPTGDGGAAEDDIC